VISNTGGEGGSYQRSVQVPLMYISPLNVTSLAHAYTPAVKDSPVIKPALMLTFAAATVREAASVYATSASPMAIVRAAATAPP